MRLFDVSVNLKKKILSPTSSCSANGIQIKINTTPAQQEEKTKLNSQGNAVCFSRFTKTQASLGKIHDSDVQIQESKSHAKQHHHHHQHHHQHTPSTSSQTTFPHVTHDSFVKKEKTSLRPYPKRSSGVVSKSHVFFFGQNGNYDHDHKNNQSIGRRFWTFISEFAKKNLRCTSNGRTRQLTTAKSNKSNVLAKNWFHFESLSSNCGG